MSEYVNKEIKITEVEEHEDGSATLQVECDPETFAAIFNAGFIDMCNLRCKMDTQYETRLVAEYILSEMINLFPVSVEALVK